MKEITGEDTLHIVSSLKHVRFKINVLYDVEENKMSE